jgi:hypothetical protein
MRQINVKNSAGLITNNEEGKRVYGSSILEQKINCIRKQRKEKRCYQ